MKKPGAKLRRKQHLPGVLMITIILSVMVACEQPASAPGATAVALAPAAPTLSQAEAAVTFDAGKELSAELAKPMSPPTLTELALRPVTPILVPPPPTDTPGPPPPSPTLIMGILPRCQPRTGARFVFNNCWRGVVDSDLISIGAGIDVQSRTSNNAVVVVYPGPYANGSPDNAASYGTPSDIGTVEIFSVNGSQVTLAQVNNGDVLVPNGQFILFDLVTRQFLNAAGTPIPTTPIPSPGP